MAGCSRRISGLFSGYDFAFRGVGFPESRSASEYVLKPGHGFSGDQKDGSRQRLSAVHRQTPETDLVLIMIRLNRFGEGNHSGRRILTTADSV